MLIFSFSLTEYPSSILSSTSIIMVYYQNILGGLILFLSLKKNAKTDTEQLRKLSQSGTSENGQGKIGN